MTRRAATKHNSEWLEVQANVPREKCGLVMVAMDDSQFEAILDIEAKSKVNGEDVRIITPEQLRLLEPDLEVASEAKAALYSPEEYVVDAYLMALSNLYVALFHGCQLETRCRVIHVEKDSNLWKVSAEKRNNSEEAGKLSQAFFLAKKVINCGGNYSDELDSLVPRTIDETPPFTIEPARGEYLVYEEDHHESKGPRGMVTEVPTKDYAGLYIFKSVYGHYVVGPTNIPQESKEDRGCSVDNVAKLESHIFKFFPGLKRHKLVAVYSGLRPRALESLDYQIRFNHDKSWATLGAIRSTGLTASRAIAEYCAKNMFANYETMARKPDVVMPLPKIEGGQGLIRVGDFTFRPTHKLSQLGLTPKPKRSSL